MENKLVKDMSREEFMEALNLIAREGINKAQFDRSKVAAKNNTEEETEEVRTITIEKYGCTATIETSINDDVQVEVYEEVYQESDEQFGRRVRFHFKVEQFRKQQAIRDAREARKPKIVRKFNKLKEDISTATNKAFDDFIDRLGR